MTPSLKQIFHILERTDITGAGGGWHRAHAIHDWTKGGEEWRRLVGGVNGAN